jgi:PAS domain S-box-containing protein
MIVAAVAMLIPALHPVLIPVVGAPSHLLWFVHVLPVALLSLAFGLPGAAFATGFSAVWVGAGETWFGGGYGTPAPSGTVLALAIAVGLTDLLVGGFALAVRAEQKRRRAVNDMVSAALSTSTDAILLLDQELRVRYANGAAGRLFGAEPARLGGVPFEELLADARAAREAGTLEAAEKQPVEVLARTPDGRNFAAQLGISHVLDAQRRQIACLITMRDHSERLREEQAARRAQALSELGAVVASIAHELNNPLTAVVGFGELLEGESALPRKVRDDVEVMVREARRASGIARQLLNLVRRGDLARQQVDLNDLVRRTLKAQGKVFAAHRIEVSAELAPQLPGVSVVPGEIEQVLVNLLGNAVHEMHSAHGRGKLAATTRAVSGSVEITVSDDGPGVRPEVLGRLFDAFFTTKAVGAGTGLGLSIARRIARDHGGDLTVESTPGSGARFTLRLPVASHAPEARPPARRSAVASEGRGARILIIDDEPAIRESLGRLLAARGFRVASAGDRDEGLTRIEETNPDIVLCDVHLGDASGMELYREAAAAFPRLRDRFVFMTGDVLSAELREFFAATGARYLAKPFEIADVLRELAPVDREPRTPVRESAATQAFISGAARRGSSLTR